MNVLLRRLRDDKEVEDQIQNLIVICAKSQDVYIQVKLFLNFLLIYKYFQKFRFLFHLKFLFHIDG